MAIKKPLTKAPLKSAKKAAPVKSALKKRPREVEEEEEETSEEEEDEHADETPKERRLRLKQEALDAAEEEEEPAEEEQEEEEDEEEAPRRKGSAKKSKKKAKQSLADIFDSTKPGRGTFPVGDFTATVVFELVGEIAEDPDDQEELKVIAHFTGINNDDEDVDEKKIGRQQYILWTDDGEPGQGIQYLKGDLDILGYEDVTLADLEEIFESVEADEDPVVIKNKEKGGYVNTYIQGLADGE